MNENYDNFKSYFTNEDEFNSWYEIVKDILNNEEFKKRVYFKHHEKQSLYTHSLLVSIFAYKYAKSEKKRLILFTLSNLTGTVFYIVLPKHSLVLVIFSLVHFHLVVLMLQQLVFYL